MATEITVSTFTTTFTGKANTTFKLGDNYTVNLFGDGVLIKQVIFTAAGKYANPQRAQQDVKFDAEQAGALSTDGNTKYKLAPPPPSPPLPPSPPPPPKPAPAPVVKDKEQTQPRYIPETRYQKPKSTGGGEFNIKKTGEDYKGKYIETFDKKYYAGSTPEENGDELEKVNEEFPIGLAFAALPVLLGLLKGFFKPKLKKGDKEKGFTKRFFVQDKKNNKIQETDQETYLQANGLANLNLAQVNWIIKGPAEDKNFNGYPFEGAASKNKKAINALESQMPGISTFITDYAFLVEDLATGQKPTLSTSTEVEKDPQTQLENDRKANFDLKK